jgi:hypothetical protein
LVEEGKMICRGKGDSGKLNLVFSDKVEGTGRGTYNVELFKGIIKSLGGLADRVIIAIGDNGPIRLNIFLTDKLSMTYYLAPKVGD